MDAAALGAALLLLVPSPLVWQFAASSQRRLLIVGSLPTWSLLLVLIAIVRDAGPRTAAARNAT